MKIHLDNGQTLEEAEDLLEKSIKKKRECSGKEEYSDPALNELHDKVCENHSQVLDNIKKEITAEIERHVSSKRNF